jgi:polyferredoxin
VASKSKRRTKHRGNAAGVVETRGRTGRKPDGADKKTKGRVARMDRFNKPPSWRSAFNRALIASAVFVVAAIVVLRQNPLAGIAFGVFLILFYTPLTFYTDTFFYRRRQAKLSGQGRR